MGKFAWTTALPCAGQGCGNFIVRCQYSPYFHGKLSAHLQLICQLTIFMRNHAKLAVCRNIKNLFLMLCAVCLPMKAYAAYECNVKVLNVLIYVDGSVNVLHSGRGDYTVICNVAKDYGSVSMPTCAMWTGMLLSIKKKNGVAAFYFDGNGTCAQLPTYGNAPVPIYIGDMTP